MAVVTQLVNHPVAELVIGLYRVVVRYDGSVRTVDCAVPSDHPRAAVAAEGPDSPLNPWLSLAVWTAALESAKWQPACLR